MKGFRTIVGFLIFLVAGLAVAGGLFVSAQANGDRLILKDGTYQIITKYEIKGDVVRYFSTEREEWEEIPSNLIDWTATVKWRHEQGLDTSTPSTTTNPADPGQEAAAKIDAEERAARQAELERMPIILPGLRLPDESGVWVLDTFEGQPELVHVLQANGDLNRASEHSILPYEVGSKPGARELIRIDGYAAKVQLHVNQPVFYVSLDVAKGMPEPEPLDPPLTVDTHGASSIVKDKNSFSSPDSRYVVVSLNDFRNLRSATAQTIEEIAKGGNPVAMTMMKKEILPGGRWMKLTPKNSLLMGEYALMEILSPHAVNLDGWAFGVNPQAPDNKDTVTPIDAAP